jgi:hypothetical protein
MVRNFVINVFLAGFAALKRHCLGFMIIIALTLVVCRNLMFSRGTPTGMDLFSWVVWIHYLTENGFIGYFAWVPQSFGEIQQSSLYWLLATLNSLLHDSSLLIKIFILTILLFSGFSMYLFTYHCTKKKVASLFSAVIFMTSQFYIGQWTSGHLNIAFAYAIGPILFLSYNKALESGKIRSILTFSAMISTLAVFVRLDTLAYYAPFLILLALFTVIIPQNSVKRRTVLIHILKITVIGGMFTFLFCAFQFLPNLLGVRAPQFGLSYPIELFVNYSEPLFESLLGVAKEVYLAPPNTVHFFYLAPSQYPLLATILVVFAFSALFFHRDKLTLFLTVSALTSVFLAKGPRQPFGELFLWLYFNVPFFNVLRVPNRWLMITYFSYAFLAGIAANAIYDKLQSLQNLKFNKSTNAYRLLKKTLIPLPQIFLTLVLVATSFTSWYAISNGLPTWRLPETYVYPHLWVAQQSGDFRVATVPYHQAWMNTGVSWGHDLIASIDLGHGSSVFHGRSVVGTGGWDMHASDFVSYSYGLVLTNGTDNLMKILGAFNVKYLVVQGYLPTQALPFGYSPVYQHYFFSRQKGLQPVYVYENSTVFENKFWTPHIFPVSEYAIVVGGREAFTALTTVDNFDLSDWNLLFADQIANQLGADQLLNLLNDSPLLIFVNSEPLDLVMLTLENAIRIRAINYAYPSTDKHRYWISNDWSPTMGTLVLNRLLLSTSGNVFKTVPINVENSGQYDVWIRLQYGPSRGNLSVAMDGTELGSIVPYARHYSGLKWIKIGSAQLEQGKHDLTLTNKKSTIEWAPGISNDIDEILLVKPQHLESAINQTTKLLQQSPARIINIIEGEQMFKWTTTPHFTDWWTTEWPFNASGGWVASTTNETTWIPLKYPILKDGRYSIALRTTVGPNQGTLQIVIDGTPEFLLNTSSQELTFKWITLDPITLQAGDHTFGLYGEGRVEIDQIVIYSLNQGEDKITLDDVFKTQKPQAIISYEMINPTKYTVHVKTSAPFFLVFSEAYHNLWKAYVDGEEVQSIPAYSFINTFQTSKTGEYDIVIEFIGQRYVVYGGIISIISITLTIIYLTFGTKINRFVVRKLKLEQKREMKSDQ